MNTIVYRNFVIIEELDSTDRYVVGGQPLRISRLHNYDGMYSLFRLSGIKSPMTPGSHILAFSEPQNGPEQLVKIEVVKITEQSKVTFYQVSFGKGPNPYILTKDMVDFLFPNEFIPTELNKPISVNVRCL